tara:strand:- start:1331 stop:1432 length:102 start_codon:yes stop_codon:yes gene_type:complete
MHEINYKTLQLGMTHDKITVTLVKAQIMEAMPV